MATPSHFSPQNVALFLPFPATVSLFLCLSLGVFSWNFGVVFFLKRRDPQMCTFGLTSCRVKPRRLLQNVKNIFTINLLPGQTSEKVNDQLLQILLVSKKQRRTLRHTSWPHFFWVVVCAAFAAVFAVFHVCAACCLCFLFLLFLLFLMLFNFCLHCCFCFCVLLLLLCAAAFCRCKTMKDVGAPVGWSSNQTINPQQCTGKLAAEFSH